jgi:nucleoid-associated protein YgaU
VKEGETLGAISARYYGDANLWPRIHRANEHVLDSPDRVWPGTTLILP